MRGCKSSVDFTGAVITVPARISIPFPIAVPVPIPISPLVFIALSIVLTVPPMFVPVTVITTTAGKASAAPTYTKVPPSTSCPVVHLYPGGGTRWEVGEVGGRAGGGGNWTPRVSDAGQPILGVFLYADKFPRGYTQLYLCVCVCMCMYVCVCVFVCASVNRDVCSREVGLHLCLGLCLGIRAGNLRATSVLALSIQKQVRMYRVQSTLYLLS